MQLSRLAIFDFDGTLVEDFQFVYKYLWDALGVPIEGPLETLAQFRNGSMSYSELIAADIERLQRLDVDRDRLTRMFADVSLRTGTKATVEQLRAWGFGTYIVSGGIDIVIDAILGTSRSLFDGVFANQYLFGEDGRLLSAVGTPFDYDGKAECMRALAERHGITVQQCLFVGDSFNDVEAARKAGLSIAFASSSSELISASHLSIDGPSLESILPAAWEFSGVGSPA